MFASARGDVLVSDVTTSERSLGQLRLDFQRHGGRNLAFPVAGALAWTAAGVAGALLPDETASYALFICSGAIFPVALTLARVFDEQVFGEGNELDRLFGAGLIMVQLLWAIAIPFWMVMPASLPLTIGVMSGLHWLIYGWIIEHWIGRFHAVTRALLVAACWFAFPAQRFTAIPAVIVAIYAVSIYVLATRPLRQQIKASSV